MPCKRVSLSTRDLFRKLERVRLPGFFREKKSISGFLSSTQRTLRFEEWGPSGILVKEQGSIELI